MAGEVCRGQGNGSNRWGGAGKVYVGHNCEDAGDVANISQPRNDRRIHAAEAGGGGGGGGGGI